MRTQGETQKQGKRQEADAGGQHGGQGGTSKGILGNRIALSSPSFHYKVLGTPCTSQRLCGVNLWGRVESTRYFNVSLEKSEAPPATDRLPQTWKGSKELIQPFTSNPLTVSPARWLASVWTRSDREITLNFPAVLTLGSVSSYWQYVCLKWPSSGHGLH